MQVGISQLIVGDMPIAEFFQQSAAAGYEVVELALKQKGAITLATPEAQLKNIAAQATAAKLKLVSICLIHLTGNLLGKGNDQRKGIDETIAGLRIAKTLGITNALHT